MASSKGYLRSESFLRVQMIEQRRLLQKLALTRTNLLLEYLLYQ